MDFLMVYVTCKDGYEAKKIASHMLEKRLVACANMFPVKSMYWWEGKIEKEDEVVLLMKTQEGYREDIIKEVLRLHSYDVPCVEFFDIKDGNPEYLDWIKKETKPC
jgi:periplasmic divalent cation tolerance protein